MNTMLRPAALALLLAIPAAGARDLPPLDVMGPFDTPASVAERSPMPQPVRSEGRHRGGDAGVENARSVPTAMPMQAPLVDIGGGTPRERLLDEVAGGRKDKGRKPGGGKD